MLSGIYLVIVVFDGEHLRGAQRRAEEHHVVDVAVVGEARIRQVARGASVCDRRHGRSRVKSAIHVEGDISVAGGDHHAQVSPRVGREHIWAVVGASGLQVESLRAGAVEPVEVVTVEIEDARAAAKGGDVDPGGRGHDVLDGGAAGARNGRVAAAQVDGRARAAVAIAYKTAIARERVHRVAGHAVRVVAVEVPVVDEAARKAYSCRRRCGGRSRGRGCGRGGRSRGRGCGRGCGCGRRSSGRGCGGRGGGCFGGRGRRCSCACNLCRGCECRCCGRGCGRRRGSGRRGRRGRRCCCGQCSHASNEIESKTKQQRKCNVIPYNSGHAFYHAFW